MNLIKSANSNVNYLAKIVKIDEFRKHSDPEVTKLKCCTVDGFNIICGINDKPGLYVYFPTACVLNPDFVRFANLYKNKNLNNDPEKSGMFEDNCRVKAIKLRGELSEGFILPVTILENYLISITNINYECKEGTEFDSFEHQGKSFWINTKYIARPEKITNLPKEKKAKEPKGLDKLVENQFRFHYDTVVIKKCPNVIKPNDLISITAKVHGTSGISAHVLCRQPLNWKQIIAKWLTGEEFNIYDYLYSSRTVIKNRKYNKNVSTGFYGCDIWKEADDIIRPKLQKGMTVYYEIIGFLPNGNYIQKNYDYGYVPPKNDFKYGINFGIQVYRITLTNVDGKVHEFSAREVQQYCILNGLVPVEEYYYGYAKDLYPDLDIENHWNENFLEKLSNDKNFYMEEFSPLCSNKVPHEGIVIKKENMVSEAFKLKCFKFIDKEGKALDKGEINMEDNA